MTIMTMPARCRSTAATAALLALLAAPALADKGDKRGWTLDTDPRKRAFLKYVPANDGPRLLLLGCLRDVDNFLVISEQAGAGPDTVTLTLANGAARTSFEGKVEAFGAGVGQAGFTSEFDIDDAKARQELRAKLLPVLEGKGPIVLTLGDASQEIPVTGLSKPLEGFKSICFR
jgi:hypothetical protein